jgi:hypothetical protein
MAKTKLALVGILCLAFAPAAPAEELVSMPPNSRDYGYVDGTQYKKPLWGNGYNTFARVGRGASSRAQVGRRPSRSISAQGKPHFGRTGRADF